MINILGVSNCKISIFGLWRSTRAVNYHFLASVCEVLKTARLKHLSIHLELGGVCVCVCVHVCVMCVCVCVRVCRIRSSPLSGSLIFYFSEIYHQDQ